MGGDAYLTKRQHEVLRVMAESQLTTGMPPTVRGIGASLGLSAAGVHEHLVHLARKGVIEVGKKYQQRRYRVPKHVLSRFAGEDTITMLASWQALQPGAKAEFANFVLAWWAQKEQQK